MPKDGGLNTKTKILCELKRSLLLSLWLLMVQTLSAMLIMAAMAVTLVWDLAAYGGAHLAGPTPLWGWAAGGALICLFWLAMGRFAPRGVRPGRAGTAAVLTAWAVLTPLTWNAVYLLLLPQKLLGGMLGQLLRFLGCGTWNDERAALTACFLLPAAFGAGLLWGWKRAGAAQARHRK